MAPVYLYFIAALVGLAIGFGIKALHQHGARQKADDLTRDAEREAETILKEAKIAAKEELLKCRDEFEASSKERRLELQRLEERQSTRETNQERKAEMLDSRVRDLEKREGFLRVREEESRSEKQHLDELIGQEVKKLEQISAMTQEAAKKQLLDRLGEQLESERGALIRRAQQETKQRLEREGHEIMITAMERYAGDCTFERTTSTIPLPNDEMKGRIIGREGRNIRAIEAAAGVNVLIDDTPEAVVISCFDPVRREIARVALGRLVSDGRIHPTRIEDMVNKVKSEIEDDILKTGQETVEHMGLPSMRQNIVKLLGRLKYRYSYSQNVLQHSIQVAHLMGTIAAQLNLDEQKARRIGLLHDIGKAVDHEIEGTHALIGADILKRAGESEDVVLAVGAHHEEMERTSPMGILVCICDTISASRPGARAETTELYLKRLEQMEEIAKSFDGVDSCFAIQAGRELRVIVEAGKVNENNAAIMARDIANRVESEMRYPGQVKVSVIRETRAVEYAR
jgi:ribonuclease Y